jgi:anti-sigma factor RsiW
VSASDNDVTPHPTELELAAYLDGSASAALRERIEAHLADCPECRHDVVAARSLRPRRRFSSRRVVGALAAAAAVLLVAVTLVVRSGSNVVREPAMRGAASDTDRIAIFEPSGVAHGRSVRFTWARVPSALTYRLTVSRSDGASVWTRSVVDTSAFMPDSFVASGGQRYVWTVDALLSDGTERSSGLREFELAP